MKSEYEKPWQEVLGEKGGPEQKFLVALPAKFLAGTILPHKGPPRHHLRVRLRGALLVRGSGHPAITNTPQNPPQTPKNHSRAHCPPLLLCFYGKHLCGNQG